MRKHKLALALSLVSLLFASVVGGGFAIYYFGETSDSASAGVKVDDIKDNYELADDAGDSNNFYTVYFFAQPLAGSQNLSGSNLSSYVPSADQRQTGNGTRYFYGSWEGETTDANIDAQKNHPDTGWRSLTVYRSLTVANIEDIGRVITGKMMNEGADASSTQNNDGTNFLMFTGWTANKSQAWTLFNEGTDAEYDMFDATQSLQLLDQSDIDGSEANDNIIYLYPVFTRTEDIQQGQGSTGEQSKHTYFRVIDNGEDLMMSRKILRTDNQDNAYDLPNKDSVYAQYMYFNYNNLVVGDDDNLTINVEGNFTDKDGDYSNFTKVPPSSASLIDAPGVYNLHVYCVNTRWRIDGGGGDDQIRENVLTTAQDFADNQNGVIVNKQEYTYGEDEANYSWSTGLFGYQHKYLRYYIIILVERVYEFKPLGGPVGNTFDYNDADRTFFQGEIGTNKNNQNNSDGTFYRTYGLNNVYFDSRDITFGSNIVGSTPDQTVQSTFRSNVFTVDFWNTLWNFSFTEFTSDELAGINSPSNSSNDGLTFENISEDGILQRAVTDDKGTTADTSLDDTVDYRLSTGAKARREMLKIPTPGYYDLRLQVKFMRSSTSDAPLNNYVEEIKIAAARVTKMNQIWIYQNNEFNKDEDGFIILDDDNLPSGNQKLTTFYYKEPGIDWTSDHIFSDEELTTHANIADWTELNLEEGYALYDHVTGKKVDDTFLLEGKNYVFYIGEA